MLFLFSAVIALNAKASDERLPVHGLVIDKDTREGIPDATVTIICPMSEESVKTDSSGHFVIYAHRCETCRIYAYQESYTPESIFGIEISTCTPFIRIDMNREIMRESYDRIERLIELSEYTYVETIHEPVNLEEEIIRLNANKRLYSLRPKCIRYEHNSDIKRIINECGKEMVKPTEQLARHSNEPLTETYSKKDIRRLINRLRANRKNQA